MTEELTATRRRWRPNWPRIVGLTAGFAFGIWAWIQFFRLAWPSIARALGGL